MKRSALSYSVILICIILFVLFSDNLYIHKEGMGSGGDRESRMPMKSENQINIECQTAYLQNIKSTLTSPTVDKDGFVLADKDIVQKLKAVENGCKWGDKTDLEKKYSNYQNQLGTTPDKQYFNRLLTAVS